MTGVEVVGGEPVVETTGRGLGWSESVRSLMRMWRLIWWIYVFGGVLMFRLL